MRLRLGAFYLSFFMNSFYAYKRVRGNCPVDMDEHSLAHWEEYVPGDGVINAGVRRPMEHEVIS